MRRRRGRPNRLDTLLRWVIALGAVTLLVTGRGLIWQISLKAALFSGRLMLPLSGGQTSSSHPQEDDENFDSSTITSSIASDNTSSVTQTEQSPVSGTTSSQIVKEDTKKPILEQMLMPDVKDISTEGITLSNKTAKHTVNITAELNKQPAIQIFKSSRPQVLIMHTHTTESYLEIESATYEKDMDKRSTNEKENIIRVGNELEKALNAAGIKTIHDKTMFDYPNYTGAYERSAESIKATLKKYSSIDVVIDLHRDCIERSDDTRIKPTAVVDEKKAAQIMIISGCDEEGALPFPTWEYNLRFAVRLQKDLNKNYPGLARPILFAPRRYNMHLTKGSLLIEVGTDVNTMDEAVYSGQMLAKSLVRVLTDLS